MVIRVKFEPAAGKYRGSGALLAGCLVLYYYFRITHAYKHKYKQLDLESKFSIQENILAIVYKSKHKGKYASC